MAIQKSAAAVVAQGALQKPPLVTVVPMTRKAIAAAATTGVTASTAGTTASTAAATVGREQSPSVKVVADHVKPKPPNMNEPTPYNVFFVQKRKEIEAIEPEASLEDVTARIGIYCALAIRRTTVKLRNCHSSRAVYMILTPSFPL